MTEQLPVVAATTTPGEHELLREIEGLRRALKTRSLIGQAIGIVMTQERLTADAAFAELVRRSSRSNLKLREVAVATVAQAESQALAP
jgi:AmiR/NasT family two-component response regulator